MPRERTRRRAARSWRGGIDRQCRRRDDDRHCSSCKQNGCREPILVHPLPLSLDSCACWELVQNAKAFDCGHSMCGTCADKIVSLTAKCPVCRKRYRDAQLTPNFAVRHIVDELRVKCPYGCASAVVTKGTSSSFPSKAPTPSCAPMPLHQLGPHLRNTCPKVVVQCAQRPVKLSRHRLREHVRATGGDCPGRQVTCACGITRPAGEMIAHLNVCEAARRQPCASCVPSSGVVLSNIIMIHNNKFHHHDHG